MARGGGGGRGPAAAAAAGTKSKNFQFWGLLGASQLLEIEGVVMGCRSITIMLVAMAAVLCSCIYMIQFVLLDGDLHGRSSSFFCTQETYFQAASYSAIDTHHPQNIAAPDQEGAAPTTTTTTLSVTQIDAPTKSPSQTVGSSTSTDLSRIVFGIGAAAKNWSRRKEYIKLWWNTSSRCEKKLRGFVWLDEQVNGTWSEEDWPPYKISEDVSDRSRFNWRDGKNKSGVRLSRIVSETFRLGLPQVDWFVIGDDDTFFFPENLAKVLSRYDHTRMYYVGSSSETHTQNVYFSYNMAFGGGGFAISFPLAKALAQMQDQCNFRYGRMLGSDDRIYACISELGVPLTKNPGFHQMDIKEDAFGILAAHPVTPILSIHHLDAISSIFPKMNQVQALGKLSEATKVESGSLLQQSICYDEELNWSFSVSWGYVVHVHYGFLKPHEMEVPVQTFGSLHRKWQASEFSINLRGYPKDHCTHPTRYYMESVRALELDNNSNSSQGPLLESIYSMGDDERKAKARCNQTFREVLNSVNRIQVLKEPIDEDWYQAPQRSCCKIKSWDKEEIGIYIGTCEEGKFLLGK